MPYRSPTIPTLSSQTRLLRKLFNDGLDFDTAINKKFGVLSIEKIDAFKAMWAVWQKTTGEK